MPELYNYQKEIVRQMIEKKGNCLLAVEQGLGKTIITLAFLNKFKIFPKTLLIIPPILYKNWINEIKKWIDKDIKIQYFHSTSDFVDPDADIYIISYQKFIKIYYDFVDVDIDCLILDESHWIKNPQSKRFKALMYLLKEKDIPMKILLTGTPIYNKPIDLWTQFKVINRKLFPSFTKFANTFTYVKRSKYGYLEYNGVKNLKLLKDIIKPYLIRVTWDMIDEIEIPPLITKRIQVGKASHDIVKLFKKIELMNNGLEKEKAKKTAYERVGKQKIPAVVELCLDLLESQDRIVVFGFHREVLERYKELFERKKIKAGILYGKLTSEQKVKLIEDLRNKKIRVLLINYQAGGVGLNLEFVKCAVFAELSYVPTEIWQAMMRVFRITSKSPIVVYFPYLTNSYEEHMINLLLDKEHYFDKVLSMSKQLKIPFTKKKKSWIKKLFGF